MVGLGTRSGHPRPEIDHDLASQRLDVAAHEQRPLARHDLVALVAASSVAGAEATVIESVADSLVEVSGAPLSRGGAPVRRQHGGRASIARVEPRWRAEDVRRALEQGSDLLVPERPGATQIVRQPTTGRDRGLDRGQRLDRSQQLDVEPDPRRASLVRSR